MAEGHVITVTGPRGADSLGVVDAHDHLLIDSPGMPGQGFTDPGKAIEEVLEGLTSGIGTIVEMSPIGHGRDPAVLRAVATLKPAVDGFFDDVMVMAEDPAVRANRLALMRRVAALFSDLADFRKIQAELPPGAGGKKVA